MAKRQRKRSLDQVALEKHLAELFRRMPMLVGFSVRQDLQFEDISFCVWPEFAAGEHFYADVLDALAQLAQERPKAIKLLRGRTFARAIH